MISQNQIDKAIERAKILFSPAGFGMLKDLFFKYGVGLAILFLGLVSVYVNVMVLVHVPTANGDSVEHIHSSFLVALGYVPYRDFFQHHNPLMWFIFAPVTWFFRYDVTVSEVLSFISFMVEYTNSSISTTALWSPISLAVSSSKLVCPISSMV